MTDGELTGAIVAHAAVACGTTTIDLMAAAGTPHGAILDARTLAVWLAAKLRPDWDKQRIGVSFNMTPNEITRYLGRASQKRNRNLPWRLKCDRVLETIQAQIAGPPPKEEPVPVHKRTTRPSDARRWELEPLTERDVDTVNWGGEGFGRDALKKQNAKFAAAMIAAGYRPTQKLELEPEKVE